MATIKLTGRTVWVAVSTHVEVNEGISPVMAVGDSAEAAQAALEAAIAEQYDEGDDWDRDMWIDEHPIELPIHTLA